MSSTPHVGSGPRPAGGNVDDVAGRRHDGFERPRRMAWRRAMEQAATFAAPGPAPHPPPPLPLPPRAGTAAPSAAPPTAGTRELAEAAEAARAALAAAAPPSALGSPRVHAEWTDEGVRLWVGVDHHPSTPLHQLTRPLLDGVRRALAARGVRLRALVCNGRIVKDGEALEPAAPLPHHPEEVP